MGEQASLKDIVGYTPDSYFSEEEVSLIQQVFGGVTGKKMLKIVRKVLIPTLLDPELPVEEVAGDPWMALTKFDQMPVEQVKAVVMGRQEAMKYALGALVKLTQIANSKPLSPAEKASARAKNSAK